MTLDLDKHQRKLEKKISEFSGTFMSDSKWTRLFTALSSHHHLIQKCMIKDVFDDILREIKIPSCKDYDLTFSDKGIKDVMLGGPSTFKQIQWVEFPSHWTIARNARSESLEPFQYHQEINSIYDIVNEVGQFATEMTPDKLRVYGYR